MNDRLLAKSVTRSQAATESVLLPIHLRDVYDAAGQILEATADDQLRALGLPCEKYRDRLFAIVRFAAAVHDLGKANDHFQRMVHGRRDPQGLRHEWVTLLMLETVQLRAWLSKSLPDHRDWLIAEWAVTGHHPGYGRPSPPRLPVDGAGDGIAMCLDHPDFTACLAWLAEVFHLSGALAELPASIRQVPLVGRDNAFTQIFRFHQRSMAAWAQFSREERALVAAAKSALIAADVAGSALPREIEGETNRMQWIAESFKRRPTAGDFKAIIDDKLDGKELYAFQSAVAESGASVVLLEAGCGNGKTVTAYERARLRHPTRQLFFCYPTTGTATEGFRGYLVTEDHPRLGGRLFHGRADIDLDLLGVAETKDEDRDDLARIESLDAWSTRIASCTVDTVLGIVQNNRRGLFAWPAVAGAALVFDEIHAYDDRLFGALLRFLTELRGIPVLLMTASLPQARRKAIEQCLKRAERSFEAFGGNKGLEGLPRYRLAKVDDPLQEAKQEFGRGGNTLWICNTVDRVIRTANAAAEVGLEPIVYHSRFVYEDRVKRHERVVKAFEPGNRGSLAICSQVAEVSLDLKAVTLLVSEKAPVPALTQRLGRLSRCGGEVRPFIIIEPRSADGSLNYLPYSPEDFELSERWLAALPDGDLSQTSLAAAWQGLREVATRSPAFVPSAWLDGGPATQVLELREPSPGITVILSRHAAAVRARPRDLPRFALPMPPPPKAFKDKWRDWTRVNGVPIAPEETIHYDEDRGAVWATPKA